MLWNAGMRKRRMAVCREPDGFGWRFWVGMGARTMKLWKRLGEFWILIRELEY